MGECLIDSLHILTATKLDLQLGHYSSEVVIYENKFTTVQQLLL